MNMKKPDTNKEFNLSSTETPDDLFGNSAVSNKTGNT